MVLGLRLLDTPPMTIDLMYALGALLAGLLLVYLVFALFRAEVF